MSSDLKAALTGSISLTPQQEAIHDSMLAGKSIIVTARAGVGKTFVLETGARKLVQARPSLKGLYLVFNVKNKKEAEKKFPPQIQPLTMNGLGHRAWQAGRPRLNVNTNKAREVVEGYLTKNKLTATWEEKLQLISLLNAARNACLVPSDMNGAGFVEDTDEEWNNLIEAQELTIPPERVPEVILLSRAILKSSIQLGQLGTIDFSDQIYLPVCFGGNWPSCDIILGDEVQDWSPANHKMVRLSRAPQKVLVGDPKQAIYAFRGAMTDSMDHLENCMPLGTQWVHLSLTKTFRCGKKIVARQQSFCPDFEAAESNPEGEIIRWPRGAPAGARGPDLEDTSNWTPQEIPDGSAILCRVNAPLISCALKLLRARRKVTVLGRDFADRLKKDLSKATKGGSGSMPIEEVLEKVKTFYESKLEGPKKPTEQQLAEIQDRVAAVEALSEGCERLSDLSDTIDRVFSDEVAPITLATGHKAKGLEWDWVMHLDPWRVPSKFAQNNPEQLAQEYNLKYVIETRAKRTLVLANLEDMEV